MKQKILLGISSASGTGGLGLAGTHLATNEKVITKLNKEVLPINSSNKFIKESWKSKALILKSKGELSEIWGNPTENKTEEWGKQLEQWCSYKYSSSYKSWLGKMSNEEFEKIKSFCSFKEWSISIGGNNGTSGS